MRGSVLEVTNNAWDWVQMTNLERTKTFPKEMSTHCLTQDVQQLCAGRVLGQGPIMNT